MTHPKAWKLILAGLGTAGVAVAIAVPMAMAGGGEPSQEQAAGTDPLTLGVPAPGFAGKVDEMIVGDGPSEPLSDDGEAAHGEDVPIEIGPITLPVKPGSLIHDVKGIAVGEPVSADGGPVVVNVSDLPPADVEIADEPHEAPKPGLVRDSQP